MCLPDGTLRLYADYQEGCFPTVKSQSLLLDINATDLVITFEYVKKEAVPYTAPVAPLASTGVLIDLCTPVTGRAPEGYTLSVNVLASAIQSVPAEAVGQAWGVSIAPGSVTAYSAGN